MSMRRLASFVAIFLLLSTALPALACVTDRAMSPQESACCRTMHGKCGQMVKQGCCRMELRTNERPQLLTATPHTDVQWAVVASVASVAILDRTISLLLLQTAADHAPPELVATTNAVLRI